MGAVSLGALPAEVHELQCMEIWSGNRSVENTAASPGVEAWIFSQTYHGESRGGDVHYLSLCAGGIVTRLVLADVSGHGDAVADSSRMLKSLLRRFMNSKTQTRLIRELNREFTAMEQRGRFATAVVATWLSHRNRLLLTNAGHPRPLVYRQNAGEWAYLSHESEAADMTADNLPLGIDGESSYQHFQLPVQAGDWMVLYTDAFTEACRPDGQMLGEAGLLEKIREVPISDSAVRFGQQLRASVDGWVENSPVHDDATLIVLRFVETRRVPGPMERLRGYRQVVQNLFR